MFGDIVCLNTWTAIQNFGLSVLASLIAFWLLVFSTWNRRPRLYVKNHPLSENSIPIPTDGKIRKCRWLHVEVDNRPKWPFKWVESASACEARIEFLDSQGGPHLQTPMVGRWARTPEPIAYIVAANFLGCYFR